MPNSLSAQGVLMRAKTILFFFWIIKPIFQAKLTAAHHRPRAQVNAVLSAFKALKHGKCIPQIHHSLLRSKMVKTLENFAKNSEKNN